ncbi:MAG TPA: ABC transporter ATP-binding protein [Gemmataceae bacterium]|nr:ABC transporter ATP-binding protein [Gemmataceae bacterium]
MADAAHDHDHDAHPPARPMARVRALLRPERRDLVTVVVFALAVAVLSLATPIAVESLVNTVSFGVLLWPVLVIAAVLLGCLGLAAAVRALQVYVVECLQRRLFVRVVADYANRLPRVRLDALDNRYGPELANRFFDILTVQKSLAMLLLDGVAIVVTAAVGLVVLAFYHPFLLGFDLVLIGLIAVLLFGLGRGGVRTALRESHAKYDVAAWLEELLRGLRGLKFAAGPGLALATADRLADEYVTARRAHFRVVWRQTLFALGLQVLASVALLGLGGWLVIEKRLTLGQLVAAELIVSLVVASVAKLGKYTESFYDLLAGAEKLGLLTDLPLDRAGGEPVPAGDRGLAVRARGVGRWPDWRAGPGERVAVCGPPGAGKTHLFEVVCGLRDAEGGLVEVEGIDLRGLDLDDYRARAALVGGADLFLGTVLENVRVGRTDLDPTAVRQALDAVGLTETVHGLPDGLDTPLTPDGSHLSDSQAVRLTLARALAGRPRLLILDGTLDALDLRDCPRLVDRLFDRAAPWTLLVASADPDVIARCDRAVEVAGWHQPGLPAH